MKFEPGQRVLFRPLISEDQLLGREPIEKAYDPTMRLRGVVVNRAGELFVPDGAGGVRHPCYRVLSDGKTYRAVEGLMWPDAAAWDAEEI